MTEHTATPWEISYDNDGNGAYVQWYNVGPARVEFGRGENDQAILDAELIARAVNNHDALVVALKEIARDPKGAYKIEREPYLENVITWCQERAEAALALVEDK